MKNVVSFSLWGSHPKYWRGALENIRIVNELLPGWYCRFYIDDACPPVLKQSIKGDNVEVVPVSRDDLIQSDGPLSLEEDYRGMYWRFRAADDPDVDIFLSRDCDSRIGLREMAAINEWLSSDKDFHIMRDHIDHNTEILGGMWGCRNGLLRKMKITKLIQDYGNYRNKGVDQYFLRDKVYPLIKNTAFEHSEFNLNFGNETRPFPTFRINYEFVGEIYTEDNKRENHWEQIRPLKSVGWD